MRAIVKEERMEDLQNSYFPAWYAYDTFPVDYQDLSRMDNMLIANPHCAVSFQLIPTYYNAEELAEQYGGMQEQGKALYDQYDKYGEQIGHLASEKELYKDENEWNSYMNEKINAQDDVVGRQNGLRGKMRNMEAEMERRKQH